jgi:hypothetical protein
LVKTPVVPAATTHAVVIGERVLAKAEPAAWWKSFRLVLRNSCIGLMNSVFCRGDVR